eukprot:TRINITY_DN4439_c0_g1_i1.p1 TRINITY_DN4439_c0_g1~~TRINITY_DN4439_c0_g1_i1.p1  ORF type:complete len:345 (-),score=87.49 TRINITY_DN4439_c0_g1_i1:91-1125(-)
MGNIIMRAVTYEEFNGEFLFNEIPKPTKISSNHLLIRVHATSINPVDYKVHHGNLGIATPSFPIIPCSDFSGEIVEMGPKCKNQFNIGDEVYGWRAAAGFSATTKTTGALCEYMLVHENTAALKPVLLSHVESASIPLVGITGLQSLEKHIQEGSMVLVLGGSGGTGSFAIQYLKANGCYVATTCSTRNVELVTRLGADVVINYQEENWWETLPEKSYDVIYDCVGGYDSWEKSSIVLKPNAAFVTIAGDSQGPLNAGRIFKSATGFINRKFWDVVSNAPSYNFVLASDMKSSAQLPILTELLEQGRITPVIDEVFNFEQAREAFEYMETGKASGKIVIKIIDE